MSGRSRKRPLDNIPHGSANLTPLGSRSTPGGLLPTPKPSSSETRRHSDVAVRPSRHSEEGRWHSNAGASPSKVSRLAGCELAGEEAELQFPEVHHMVSFPGQMSGLGMRLCGMCVYLILQLIHHTCTHTHTGQNNAQQCPPVAFATTKQDT